MLIIVGLGNPGKEYEQTRHNVGFLSIDAMARRWGIQVTKSKFQALYGEGTLAGEKVVLVKPMTYMNLSGQSVRQLWDWYKPDVSEFVVLFDDMDRPAGSLRLREKGSAGGHNGIKSIISCLGTQEFQRIKIGVGRPVQGRDVINHVLNPFSKDERSLIEQTFLTTVDAVETIVKDGFTVAMNRFN